MSTLSAIIITKNEEHRIRRCLESIRWADEIVVVDSESTDGTVAICREFTDRVFMRPFDTFSAQKNAALDRATGDWILSLDADEVVSPDLAREIRTKIAAGSTPCTGFVVRRENYLCGYPIRNVWQNDTQLRLFQRGRGRFVKALHEEVILEGPVGTLTHPLLHYNSDSLREYIAKNDLYTTFEARGKYERGERFRLAKLLFSPPRVFWFRYIRIGGYKDGMMGFTLSVLLAYFVFQVHLKMRRMGTTGRGSGSSTRVGDGSVGDCPPVQR